MRSIATRAALALAWSLAVGPGSAAAEFDPPVRFTVAASGDMLTQQPVLDGAFVPGPPERYDFVPLLRRVAPAIGRADLAICHQEFVLGPGPPQLGPRWRSPRSLAAAMGALGWDVCTVASNHSVDHGSAGVRSTIVALRRAGLRHTGTYVTRKSSRRLLILGVRGVRIALLSYADTTNGIPVPRRFQVNLTDRRAILRDARRARRRGADGVIVSLHTTGNFDPPGPAHRALVRRLTASPAVTAVISQGAHMVQPIRFLSGKPVVYGEGDVLDGFDGKPGPEPSSGLVAQLRFVASGSRLRVRRVRYLPLHSRDDRAAVLVGRGLRRQQAEAGALRAAYREVVSLAGRSRRVQPIPRRLPQG